MHTQFNSFTQLLRRYPLPLLGNVLGLAVALAVFIIISMEVEYNHSYDRHLKDVDRTYQFSIRSGQDDLVPVASRPMCDNMKEQSPHIEAVTYRKPYGGERYYTLADGKEIKMPDCKVATNYYDFFGFDWIACDTTAFTDPNAVFLPESMATRFFDTMDLVRHPLDPTNPKTYIGGIFRDFPENTSVQNVIHTYLGDEDKDSKENFSYCCYVRLFDSGQKVDVEQAILQANPRLSEGGVTAVELIPYTDIHFRPDIPIDMLAKVDPDTQYLFLFIALVIIVIACINFTNLYAALCPLRIRSINTQKVLGATRSELVRAMIAETATVCVGAWLIALGIVAIAARAGLGELQHAAIDLTAHPVLVAVSFALALLMGSVSGIYPALYSTSFQPALVLKGNFGLSPKGRSLRNLLVGIQFTTAFALFICVLNVWQQNDYMRHSELGYNQNRLVSIMLDDLGCSPDQLPSIKDGLKQLAVTEHTACILFQLSSKECGMMTWERTIDETNQNVKFVGVPVSADFLRTAGIPVTEGRDFLPTDGNGFIFNETARQQFDKLRVGASILGDNVVGFCPDIKFSDIHNEVGPMAFYCCDKWPFRYLTVRIREGVTMDNALTDIRDFLRPYSPTRDIEVLSQFDVMDITYAEDAKQLKSLLIFCALAIFICLTGVFGLVVFECEYRRKEIGVRKVMGAVTGDILAMLCRRYIWILTVSFVVAAPVAWYTVDKWLQNFAYRTEILTWTFVVPLLTITAITLLTVCIQSYRTACADPMDSLRSE